jgi:hypothetical protein
MFGEIHLTSKRRHPCAVLLSIIDEFTRVERVTKLCDESVDLYPYTTT